jgi:DNA repair photolyase
MEELRHITRKSMLYRTGVEYGDWAMNHVQGCSHGCKYPCYAYLMARRFGRVSSYDDWCHPAIVDNTIDLLRHELPRYKQKISTVQLCFTTDPFMYGYDEICSMSLDAMRLINSYDLPCVALSKGVLPEELASLSKSNIYGITLVSLDEDYRKAIEPGAAPYEKRIAALEKLHDKGFHTWVSMEPYPTPNILVQDITPILERLAFTDKIIFGRTHYNKVVSSYPGCIEFYDKMARTVMEFCKEHGLDYHIKEGTLSKAKSA